MRLALLLCLLAWSSAHALEPSRDHFSFALKDATGLIWACDYHTPNQLFTFDGKQWQPVPAPLTMEAPAIPVGLCLMKDGAVACIWHLAENKAAVTLHRGDQSRLLAKFDAHVPQYEMKYAPFVDSKNRIWLTGENVYIYRIDPDGQASLVHEIMTEDSLEPNVKKDGCNPIHVLEDGKGRIWIWSREEANNYVLLKGLFLFENGKLELKEIPALKKDRGLLAMTLKDENSLYAGVMNVGLCEIDLSSFAMKPIPIPIPADRKCRCVDKIFTMNNDLFVIATPHAVPSLWRQHDGQWTEVIAKLDRYSAPDRIVYKMDKGFLLSGQFSSWFIPDVGPPLELNWQNGLPVEAIKSIFRLPDGSFLEIGRSIFQGKISLSPNRTTEQVTEFRLETNWAADAIGRIWMILHTEKNVLQFYDGKAWVSYNLPPPVETMRIDGIAPDTKGRIWLLPAFRPPAGVFLDSQTGQWHTFPTIEAAWESVKDDPPHFVGKPWMEYAPNFDKSRIAFRGGGWQLFYFNGREWQKWKAHEITGGKNSPIGMPFFNTKGQLHVNIDGATWQLEESGTWEKTDPENPYPNDPWGKISHVQTHGDVSVAAVAGSHPKAHPELPKEGFPQNPDSVVIDNRGYYWFLWQGRLYQYRDGVCMEIVGHKNPNPFGALRHIEEVLVDAYANAYVQTASNGSRWFMVRPPSPLPKTTASIKIFEDSVAINLGCNIPSMTQYRWKLDDEPLRSISKDSLTLNFIPNGKHVLQAMARDERIFSDALPVTIPFEIRFDPTPRIAKLIAQLSDADYSKRESAVVALGKYASLSLPLLQKARESADESLRWWIDAALQEAEHDRKYAITRIAK